LGQSGRTVSPFTSPRVYTGDGGVGEPAVSSLKSAVDFCHSSAVLAKRDHLARLGSDRRAIMANSFLWLPHMQQPIYRLLEPDLVHIEDSTLGGRHAPCRCHRSSITSRRCMNVRLIIVRCCRTLDWYALMIARRRRTRRDGRPWSAGNSATHTYRQIPRRGRGTIGPADGLGFGLSRLRNAVRKDWTR
jgi:hypothetical protein